MLYEKTATSQNPLNISIYIPYKNVDKYSLTIAITILVNTLNPAKETNLPQESNIKNSIQI